MMGAATASGSRTTAEAADGGSRVTTETADGGNTAMEEDTAVQEVVTVAGGRQQGSEGGCSSSKAAR
jgi:hypothetical protein